jgi:hypothetical protein
MNYIIKRWHLPKEKETQVEEQHKENLLKIEQDFFNEKIKIAQDYVNIVAEIIAGVATITAQIEKNTTTEIENESIRRTNALYRQYQIDLANAGDNEEAKAKITETYNANKEAIEKETAKKSAEMQRKMFEVNKAIAIVDSIIKGAQAVMAALTIPPPAGPILAVATGAMAAVQTALIASQQPPEIPEFAKGVTNFSGGNAVVGENGAEMVRLPRGADVISNGVMRGISMPSAQSALNSITNNNNNSKSNVSIQLNGIQNPIEFVNVLKKKYGVSVFT